MKTVVVGMDRTPEALGAARLARMILGRSGRIVLLHVLDTASVTAAPRHATPREIAAFAEQEERDARDSMGRAAAELQGAAGDGLTIDIRVRSGAPLDVLRAVSEGENADLVAVGIHARGPVGRLVFGSVAETFALESSRPTLFCRRADVVAPRLDRLLLATDESESTSGAVRCARELSRALRLPVEAIHAVAGYEARPGEARTRRHEIEALLRQAGEVDPVVHLVEGKPSTAIAEAVSVTDLLVCGTHSRGAVGRVVLGSVALNLVRHAPCPVVVARP